MKNKIVYISSIIVAIVIALSVTTSSCSLKKEWAENVEYTLTGEYVEYSDVKYAISDKGLIAIEPLNKKEEHVFVIPYPGMSVYSLASGFLKDNDYVKTLTIISSTYFESNCIENCINLKEIKLNYTAVKEIATEKDAFLLNEDTVLTIENISQYEQYIYSFQNYKKHLSFKSDVYVNYKFIYSVWVVNAEYGYKVCDEYTNLEIEGKLFGKKIEIYEQNDLNFTGNKLLFEKEEKPFSLNKVKKTNLKVSYQVSYGICLIILISTIEPIIATKGIIIIHSQVVGLALNIFIVVLKK